jgi:phenylalanyl-tRNA synthetase alpha chain
MRHLCASPFLPPHPPLSPRAGGRGLGEGGLHSTKQLPFLIVMDTADLQRALNDLESLAREGVAAFAAAKTHEDVERARVTFLGQKHGRIEQFEAFLKKLPPDGKKGFGKRFNEVKQVLKQSYLDAKDRPSSTLVHSAAGIATEAAATVASSKSAPVKPPLGFDFSLPGLRPKLGRKHPLTQTAEELVDIFGRFGFTLATGPEVEDEWHNFEALNIPRAHPARDPVDNFYVDSRTLLRSQTSTVQIRVMERQPPPVRVVAIGRVYRPDAIDATHSCMFHQIEGLYVDERVTLADLKTVLRLFAASYLGRDVHIRFRPSFFPFTEPSVEVDMSWDVRGGKWVELGGAGMVDPNVFRAVGYDPEVYSGFAFGLGIERMCMRRHGINDIRLFYENDVRFLEQF